ncbi:unnamed protein product [Tilletia laevis]|nr:unnamed protein product [Tilletia caries]CAD6924388.1 unnamed protein product [Tilletia laevis]CAD6940954.1 unnamed protein product [Tilletia caries]CAD7067549.1 unnamed protein product [Tilletia caries]
MFSSPKLQAARERLANPSELQLEPAQTQAQTAQSQQRGRRGSLRNQHQHQHQHQRFQTSSSSATVHPHSHSHSHSHHQHQHQVDRHRVLTVPVWARNEPPSPFTSPTVTPLTHTLPSLTDLAPLGPPLLEEEGQHDDQHQHQHQHENRIQPPASASSHANLQRFSSTQSSSAASSTYKPHRTNPKRWLFSRKRAPPASYQHHPAHSSTGAHSSSRRPDSDSEDEDDPDAEGPERFWSFTLPPKYRNKIKDLNSFRMSSFRAAATGNAGTAAADADEHGEDEYEDEDEQEAHAGNTTADRSKGDTPAGSADQQPVHTAQRKTPKRNNTDLSTSVRSSSSAKTTTTARPRLSTANTASRKSNGTIGTLAATAAAAAGKGKKAPQTDKKGKGKSKKNNSTGSTTKAEKPPAPHRQSTDSSINSSAHSSAGGAAASSDAAGSDDENGNGNANEPKEKEKEDPDDEYVRARRASGDGTGGVGLPRGAAAAELDQSPLMSWMRRRDSSRAPSANAGGAGGAGGPSRRESTSPTSARSPTTLGSFIFTPPTRTTTDASVGAGAGAGGKKGSGGSASAHGGTTTEEAFGLPRMAEPAHYAEPKQKQHELRLRLPPNPSRRSQQQHEAQEEEESAGDWKEKNARANGEWDEGVTTATNSHSKETAAAAAALGGSEFSRHQPRTPGWASPWRPETPTTGYPFGTAGAGGGGGLGTGGLWGTGTGAGAGGGHPHDDYGGLDLEKLGGLLGRHSGASHHHGDSKAAKRARGEEGLMARFKQFLLVNPFAPFFFRMINLSFTTATLAVAIRIHQSLASIGANAFIGSSPILAIVFAPLTLAHVLSQIYMEYFGRPIGLWSVRSKLYYTLIELVFVCFWSAELALAFDNLTTSPLECCCGAARLFVADEGDVVDRDPGRVRYVCRLQSTLAGLSFVSLLAYMVVLSVNLFRIFERLSRSTIQ